MATQIAATPVIKGQEARKVLAEAKRRPTIATKRGAEKLREEFAGMVKKDNKEWGDKLAVLDSLVGILPSNAGADAKEERLARQ